MVWLQITGFSQLQELRNPANLVIFKQLINDDTRGKIENIAAGIIIEGKNDNCTKIRNLLCASFPTSTTGKTAFGSQAIVKKERSYYLDG